MTRKQAKRRKQRKVQKFRLPTFPLRRLSAVLFAGAVIVLSYQFSAEMLDQPITSITIDGSFQRVSALQIEEAISDELESGFFSANLKAIQHQIVELAWSDQASVAREPRHGRGPAQRRCGSGRRNPAWRW